MEIGLNFGVWRIAEFKRVDHQAHRRLGRIDVFLLRDVFLEDVVLQRPGEVLPIDALFFGDGQIHGPQDRGGRIDGHRGGNASERNLVEERFHVREGTDGHAALADFAFGQRMVGVIAHQRRKIERDGKARLPLREQITESLVGILRRTEAGELAHGPEAAPVHRGWIPRV